MMEILIILFLAAAAVFWSLFLVGYVVVSIFDWFDRAWRKVKEWSR